LTLPSFPTRRSSDLLTLTSGRGDKIVINSHRAARQIWMAAYRKAWHFSPVKEGNGWRWCTATDEFHQTLRGILKERVGVDVALRSEEHTSEVQSPDH